MEIIPVTEFRTHALETIRRVNRIGEEVTISTKGRHTVVLVSHNVWESIVETLAIKQDPALRSRIKASLNYLRKGGKGIPLEKIDWDQE